ncbi:hypothetical protein D9613_002887 [Agrocybe pediades]|uniref:Uncharacterized protein n=1 Tax=Agrocybe pediades TaxID=84607 RepID=A0A8H4QQ98_9AGAR|nr:hypothetical protein D9613_002887 [Agrocybe pediades]KAF9567633.1 hypothetical protein CPC08DRAFT_740161 [Agrocybe pediades]
MSSKTTSRGLFLALLVFPAITALSATLIFGRFKAAGMDIQLRSHCKPLSPGSQVTSYRLDYTGVDGMDKPLCALVTFFHSIMDSSLSRSFLSYAIGISGPLVLLPSLESYRIGQHRALSYPVLWGFLMQTATVGITFPLYWLAFILFEGVNKHHNFNVRKIPQAQVEAIIFGLVVGAVIPSVAMLLLDDPKVTAIWQAYPVYVSIAQQAHLLFRPASKHSQSGFRTIQVLYLTLFIFSSSFHIHTVWPILSDFNAIKSMLLPSLTPLSPSEPMNHHLLEFLKWDVLLAYVATALAMLWFAKSARQVLMIILWYTVAIPLFGFGAAVMGVTIWRDGILA